MRHNWTTITGMSIAIIGAALAVVACQPALTSAPTSPPPPTSTPRASTHVSPSPVPPTDNTPPRTAALSELQNEVFACSVADAQWETAAVGQFVQTGGRVRTGEEARARLDISDGTIIRMAATSEFELRELSPGATDPMTRLKLTAGKLWAAVTEALGGGFEIETPAGLAIVRGSYISVEYFDATGQMSVTCLEGQCRLTGTSGKFTDLTDGQQAEIAGAGQDPSPAQPMDAAQYADWAQNFPGAPVPTATPSPTPRPTDTPAPEPAATLAPWPTDTPVPPPTRPPAPSIVYLLPDGCSPNPVQAGNLVISMGVGRWKTSEEAQAVVGDSIPTITANGVVATFLERTGPEWHTGYGDPGWGFSARAQITLAAGVYEVVGAWMNPDYTQRCTLTVNP
jgi:FecR-like protein